MKSKQLLEIIKSKSVSIPLYLFRERDNLNLSYEEFFFLMYLISKDDLVLFDMALFESDLNITSTSIMQLISKLCENDFISLEVTKNKEGVMEEFISLEGFYNKILKLMIEDINQEHVEEENIYDKIQTEFGRMLSPMEYEIISAWMDSSNINEELIYEAVKEAVFNGVSNLRYIDKILYEWSKKGYKNKEDVEKNRKRWKDDKPKENTVKKEVFDYNWLEEDDEDE